MRVVRCLTHKATSGELAAAPCLADDGVAAGGIAMQAKLKFYFNLAILGFTLGRAYGALRRWVARDVHGRRRVWN
jgi:hypothetical protein